MQRVGSTIGIAVIGSVFFGSLEITGRPTPSTLATAFGHSAAVSLAVSASFSALAFALVFTLPPRAGRGADG